MHKICNLTSYYTNAARKAAWLNELVAYAIQNIRNVLEPMAETETNH